EVPAVIIERTPARVERGRYLANNVVRCIGCHSKPDTKRYSLPPLAGTLGEGGQLLGDPEDPFSVYAKNITPNGIGDWSDGEILRAMTSGLDKNGDSLIPAMPYEYLRNIDQEDAYSIVAYIRTLKPVGTQFPPATWNSGFAKFLTTHLFPKPWSPVNKPATTDKVAYGGYLAHLAECDMCHSPWDSMGHPLPDKLMSGGNWFRAHYNNDDLSKFNYVVSANLTPDPTGLGNIDEAQFVGFFRAFDTPAAKAKKVGPNGPQDVMPWVELSGMTDDDLKAIYAWLKSQKPISNKVDSFPPPGATPPAN
ncbi:MAG TPA: cytochrome C, partial [Candidatus Xenobia bacterium]